MYEDVFDVLTGVIAGMFRGGLLSEVAHAAMSDVIGRADPKIEAKRQAAQAQAAKDEQDRAEFEAFKKFQASNQSAPAAPPVASSSPAGE